MIIITKTLLRVLKLLLIFYLVCYLSCISVFAFEIHDNKITQIKICENKPQNVDENSFIFLQKNENRNCKVYDIITDLKIRHYNDYGNGNNLIDGSEYLSDIYLILSKYAPEGMAISAVMAQSYTEGGSGKSGVYTKTNNCFGITASPNWEGYVYSRSTGLVYKDYQTAIKYGAKGLFRAYPTMEDSVKDYVALMQGERYSSALSTDSPQEYLSVLLYKGYGEKRMLGVWLSVIETYNLKQYDEMQNIVTYCKNIGEGLKYFLKKIYVSLNENKINARTISSSIYFYN